MKRILFALLFIMNVAYAQKWECLAKVNSGLFYYGGEGAEKTSFLEYWQGDPSMYAYTNNPYGRKSGFSYGVGSNIQRVTNWNFIYGLDFGFESVQSKMPLSQTDINGISWSGRTLLRTNFVTMSPHFGFYWNIKSVRMDLSIAGDFVKFLSKAEENVKIESAGRQIIRATDKRENPKFDSRTSYQLTAFKNKVGLSLTYAKGLNDNNFGSWAEGNGNRVFSRYLKIGLQYRLSN